MRILMITTSYPRWEGDAAGSFVHNLAAGLVKHGHQVQVLTPAAAGSSGSTVMDGVQVSRVGRSKGTIASEPGGIIPGLSRAPWRLWSLLLALIAMAKIARIRAADVDVVHGQWAFPGGFIAKRAAERVGRPAVITVHGADVNLPLRHRMLRPLFRRSVQGATRILAVSNAMYDGAIAMGVAPERVEILRLGVPEFEWTTSEQVLNSGPTRFLFIGSLTARKGVDVLIQAFALAAACEEMSLRIVGDGPLMIRVRQLIDELDLNARVELTGLVPPAALQDQFALSDALVLPSRSEGLGLVCVEAMMAGLPVLASDIPGPREVVDNGVTGMLVPAGDPAVLSGAMIEMARSPTMRVAMGKAGLARAKALGLTISGSVERHVRAYTAAIREVSR